MTDDAQQELDRAQAEAVAILQALIRIDTTNTGEPEGTVGEAEAAEYVESLLREVGYEPERFETTSGRRQGVHLRIAGQDPGREALLLHGHLDVVPAIAGDWSVDPFSGEEKDGLIWGRGAVDMKDMDAMLIAMVRSWARSGYVPPRDIVFLMTPDEEAGGWQGAHWLVDHRPELLAGVTEAVGEVGGFSISAGSDRRLYLLQTAEKGIAWLRLRASGRGGHGSFVNDDNAVTTLARVVSQIGEYPFPITLTPTMKACVAELAEALDVPFDQNDPEPFLRALGPMARIIGATLRNTANPTMLHAGYKSNVVPAMAEAHIDGRFLPGHEQELFDVVDSILGDEVTRELINHDISLETPFEGPTIEAMAAAIHSEDPQGRAIPYTMSGGTDAKSWSTLGIRCYGFVPLRLPPELDFPAMFHGIDERVPVESVKFGVRVLQRFVDMC